MNRSNENLDAAATPAEERRDAPRRRTLFSGKIIFNQQSSVFNVSEALSPFD